MYSYVTCCLYFVFRHYTLFRKVHYSLLYTGVFFHDTHVYDTGIYICMYTLNTFSNVVDIANNLLSRQFVFETASGVRLYPFQMKDLRPIKWINDGVVNCFVSMLRPRRKKW
ncbi:hypothetical protein Hanom_Chr04g00378241 [Helianthus anomalus]